MKNIPVLYLVTFILLVLFPNAIFGQTFDCSVCPDSTFKTDFYVELDNEQPETGDYICYTINTTNFRCVTVLQLFVKFNSDVLANPVFDANVSQLPWSDFSSFNGDNEWRLVLFDQLVLPNSLPDSSVLAEICFDVIGNAGEEIKFAIGGNDTFTSDIGYANDDQNIACSTNGPQNTPTISQGVVETIINPSCSSGFQAIANSLCGTQQGQNTGTARIDFFCGTGPYTIVYDTEPAITSTGDSVIINNLGAGIHTFIVTDSNGNSTPPGQFTTNTSNPLAVDLSNSTLIPTTCPTGNIDNGRAQLAITGGSPGPNGYQYDWGGVEYDEGLEAVINGVPSGIYTVTINDATNCEITQTIDLTRDTVTVTGSASPTSCSGINTGSLILQADGGTPGAGYRFRFEGIPDDGGPNFFMSIQSNNNQGSFFNLPAGRYLVSAEDRNTQVLSCPSEPIELIIGNLQDYSIATSPNLPNTCPPGEQSVIIDILRTMDGASINYQITHMENGNRVLDESDILMNQTSITTACHPLGTYQIEIQDSDGCIFIDSFLIDGCDLFIDSLVLEPICSNFDDGIILLTPFSGTEPIEYNWSTGDTTSDLQNLGPGAYAVTISDAAQCTLFYEFNLPVPEPFTIDFQVDSISCPGGITDIEAIVTGTIADEFIWEPDPVGIPFSTLPDAPAGTYSVTVIDIDGCEEVASITIGDPTPPIISVDSTTIFGPDCMGNLGSFFMQVQANPDFQGPFDFEASSGEMNSGFSFNPTNMRPGNQWVVVSTQAGCFLDSVIMSIPDAPALALDTLQSDLGTIECFGDVTDVFLFAEGISNPASVTYDWPAPYDQSTGFFKAGVEAGTYVVTLTSGICTAVETIVVTQPDSFGVNIDRNLSDLPLCNGDLANLVSTSIGGTDPISFIWTDSDGMVMSNDSTANGLGPGTYTITATDVNGCTASDSIEIESISPVVAVLGEIIQPPCFGELGQVFIDSVSGGIGGPYRYQVDSNPLVDVSDTTEVQSGDHFVLVADRNGCDTRINFTIDTPEEVSVTLSVSPPEIEIGMSGDISTDVISPSRIDTIIWQSESGLPFSCLDLTCETIRIEPIRDVTISATVINEDGCSASGDIDVNVLRSEDIYVGNIFSPFAVNSGGNSRIQIYAGAAVEALDFFRIYDRWGNLVHEEENINVVPNGASSAGWNGTKTSNGTGQRMEAGVYVWVLQARFFGDPEPQIRKGDITLVY